MDQRFGAAMAAAKRGDRKEALSLAHALIDDNYSYAYALAGGLYERGGRGVCHCGANIVGLDQPAACCWPKIVLTL